MRSYNINKRSVYAFRKLGKGYAGMKTFLTVMNLPPPTTKNTIQKQDTSVSYDGACKRCGFASMNGIMAAIFLESGDVIDNEPMSRYCQKCALKYKFKAANPKYESFLA